MKFEATLDGYNQQFNSLAELREWANRIIDRDVLVKGKQLKIWQNKKPGSGCFVCAGAPDKIITVQ